MIMTKEEAEQIFGETPPKHLVPKGYVLYQDEDGFRILHDRYTEKVFKTAFPEYTFLKIITEIPELPVEMVEE